MLKYIEINYKQRYAKSQGGKEKKDREKENKGQDGKK